MTIRVVPTEKNKRKQDIKVDEHLSKLVSMEPADIDTYVETQLANKQSTDALIKGLARAVVMIIKSRGELDDED